MKKLMYETVNEIRRNGCFTNNGFKTFANMMVGRVALSNRDKGGNEVTKFIDLVMFRDKTTGAFPFEDLFKGGKKVIFTGRYTTREYTDREGNRRQVDEIIVVDMRENLPREVEVEDAAPAPAETKAPAAKPVERDDMPADIAGDAPLPKGFEDLEF